MGWWHVWKTFQGGDLHTYFYIAKSEYKYNKNEKQFAKELADAWGEGSRGGHNYGYTLYLKKIKKPPMYALWEIKEHAERKIASLVKETSKTASFLRFIKIRYPLRALKPFEEKKGHRLQL